MIPLAEPGNNFTKAFDYIPPAKFKPGDKVTIDHAVRWGFPLDFDVSMPLEVTKDSSLIMNNQWVATVVLGDDSYEIWESSLTKVGD